MKLLSSRPKSLRLVALIIDLVSSRSRQQGLNVPGTYFSNITNDHFACGAALTRFSRFGIVFSAVITSSLFEILLRSSAAVLLGDFVFSGILQRRY